MYRFAPYSMSDYGDVDSTYYLILDLASLTAAIKNSPVKGVVSAKMMAVAWLPNSAFPEVSSKIEPTAAMAQMQEPIRNKPLLGVNVFTANHPMLLI